MKIYYLLFLFFLPFISNAQSFDKSIPTINKILGWSDSLQYNNELRIYKDFSITNGVEIFRMYEENGHWNVQTVMYFAPEKDIDSLSKYEKRKIVRLRDNYKTKYGGEYIWYQVLCSRIVNLPQWDAFEYKLSKKEAVFEEGEMFVQESVMGILDGVGYTTYIKSGDTYNFFEYHNPESYLKEFPEVDELNYFHQMIQIIQDNYAFFTK